MFSPAPFRFWACSNTPRSAQAWASEVSSGQVVIEGVSITMFRLLFRIILVTYVTSSVIMMFSKGDCGRAFGNTVICCFICTLIRINYLTRTILSLIILTCGVSVGFWTTYGRKFSLRTLTWVLSVDFYLSVIYRNFCRLENSRVVDCFLADLLQDRLLLIKRYLRRKVYLNSTFNRLKQIHNIVRKIELCVFSRSCRMNTTYTNLMAVNRYSSSHFASDFSKDKSPGIVSDTYLPLLRRTTGTNNEKRIHGKF